MTVMFLLITLGATDTRAPTIRSSLVRLIGIP